MAFLVDAIQAAHRFEVFITRQAEGKQGKAFVGKMTEEKSLELASKVASEGFIFSVCADGQRRAAGHRNWVVECLTPAATVI